MAYYMPMYDASDKEEEHFLLDVDPHDAHVYRRRIHPMEEFNPVQFRRRYRVTKQIVQALTDDFTNYVPLTGGAQGNALPIVDKVCLALRYLATGSNFSLVADYQGVSIPTVSRSVAAFTDYLYETSYKYILWPELQAEKEAIARDFYENYGYPRVLGCIDGTHIAIRKPHQNEAAFVNRKGCHSLYAMMICDAQLLFTHVNPSWPASVHDAFAYNSSPIRVLADEHRLDPYFLLGDSGYGCKPNLFTPLDNPNLDSERDYNVWHRMTRSLVERSIGQLKQRWRCLDNHGGTLYHQPARAGKIITACTALHNICIRANVPLEDDSDRDGFMHQMDVQEPEDHDHGDAVTARRTAYIANNFA